MPITADEAIDLARAFHDACMQLGRYRLDNLADLTKTQRESIERAEWDLFNVSLDLTTRAVGLDLEAIQTSVAGLKRATDKAKSAIKTINNVKKAITIAASLVDLGLAVIAKDAKGVFTSLTTLGSVLEGMKT